MFNITDVKESGYKDRNRLDISWDINKVCQYRCSYCFVNLVKKEPPEYANAYKTVLQRLSLSNMLPFNISILGGEPTLHPEMVYILKELNSNTRCRGIGLITNLVKPLDYFAEMNDISFDKTTICASFHPEYEKSIDTFIDKCISINEFKNIQFRCTVNLHPEPQFWDVTVNSIESLLSKGISLNVNLLFKPTGAHLHQSCSGAVSYDYTAEFFARFKEYIHLHDEGGFPIMVGGAIREEIPYKTESGVSLLKYDTIKNNKLFLFKGFDCTPLMIQIDPTGNMVNACTTEIIDMLGTNIKKSVICPVTDGCKCKEMLCYYKKQSK